MRKGTNSCYSGSEPTVHQRSHIPVYGVPRLVVAPYNHKSGGNERNWSKIGLTGALSCELAVLLFAPCPEINSANNEGRM